jgi:hypothetical protein
MKVSSWIESLESLFNRVTQREVEKRARRAKDFREFVILGVDSEDGAQVNADPEWVEQMLADDQERPSIDEMKKTGERYRKRKSFAALLAKEPELNNERDQLAAAAEKFDVDEAARHRAAMKKLQEMQDAAWRARLAAEETLTARNYLMDTAATTDEERALIEQQQTLGQQISTLQEKLDPGGDRVNGYPAPSYFWGNVQDSPAKLEQQTRAMLADKKVNYSKERRAELERCLSAAERATAECRRQLADLKAESGKINKRLLELAAEKLLPENFAIIRAKPNHDDRMKQHAGQFGYGRNDSGVRAGTGSTK